MQPILACVFLPVAVALHLSTLEDPDVRPVTRVVNLLKDMQQQLQQEQDSDEEVYDKLACWCSKNDKGTTQAISDEEAKIKDLSATIDSSAARSATLKVEIQGLQKEIAANQQSLESATILREKQAASFTAEEKEMLQSIKALDSAIVVLAKHHSGGAAFLDNGHATASMADARAAAGVAATILGRHQHLFRGVLTQKQRRVLHAISQDPAGYLSATPTFKQQYTAQSGEIFGILNQMKETFTNDLSESQKEELDAQKAFAELKDAKEEQISTGQKSLNDKQLQLAASDQQLVQAKDEREDTSNSLSADKQFLMDLKLRCQMTDQEWQERQKTRQSELQAVSEALSLLTSDDARDLFSRTLSPVQFLQTSRDSQSTKREHVAAALQRAAAAGGGKYGGMVATLVMKARLDDFQQVKQAIDDMAAELLKEADDEMKHREFCIDEFGKNERATAKEDHTKAKVESDIAGLETRIKGINQTIEVLQSEIADLELSRQRAKEDRDLEQKTFEGLVADQRETQSLLKQAVDALKSVYDTRTSLLQGPTEPAGLKPYEKQSERSSGILALLAQIIENAKAMEAEAVQAEAQAVEMYQGFVQKTQDSITAKEQSISDRKWEKADAEQDYAAKRSELGVTSQELETLSNSLAGLHGSCDFFVKNWDARTKAREDEVAALREAKAFLSGMQ